MAVLLGTLCSGVRALGFCSWPCSFPKQKDLALELVRDLLVLSLCPGEEYDGARLRCVADVWRFSDVTQRHEVHLSSQRFHAGLLFENDASTALQAAD